jgi:hypothetical protein
MLIGPILNVQGFFFLQSFKIANNSFTGHVPDFSGCHNVKAIDLSFNQLNGIILY